MEINKIQISEKHATRIKFFNEIGPIIQKNVQEKATYELNLENITSDLKLKTPYFQMTPKALKNVPEIHFEFINKGNNIGVCLDFEFDKKENNLNIYSKIIPLYESSCKGFNIYEQLTRDKPKTHHDSYPDPQITISSTVLRSITDENDSTLGWVIGVNFWLSSCTTVFLSYFIFKRQLEKEISTTL